MGCILFDRTTATLIGSIPFWIFPKASSSPTQSHHYLRSSPIALYLEVLAERGEEIPEPLMRVGLVK